MSDEEDYDSSEDADYVPSEGEAVSEEENSGEEEDLSLLREDGEPVKKGKRKRKSPKKKKTGPPKRAGGIRLDDEDGSGEVKEEDTRNKELEEQIKLEQEQKKKEHEKKKADDLWASFMADVGKRPEKKPVASSGLGSLTTSLNKASPVKPASSSVMSNVSSCSTSAVKPKSTITVTKVYDFAGESVQVTKEIDVNSREGKAELKKQQDAAEGKETDGVEKVEEKRVSGGVKRPGGGLGGVLEKINKKPKMGTLEKSRIDWESFKKKEGIEEELKIHNRGKASYIERMNFLQRTDHRQFEIEKNIRQSNSSKR